jgi:signal transduction histidine kinase
VNPSARPEGSYRRAEQEGSARRVPSLRGQLIRAAMLTTLIALVASSAALLFYELSTFRKVWTADIRTQADLIARSTEAALVFNDPREAERTLAVLRLQTRIRAAQVFNARGQPFAWYAATPDEPAPDPALVPLAHPAVNFEGSTVELVYPIIHDDERVGTLYLRATHDITARLRGYALILVLVSAAGLLLAYTVFGRLLTRVTAPLARMTEVAQQVMGSRNWRLRAPETEYADIAVLVRAFNGMLAESQARTSELEAEMAERERAEHGLRQADRRKDEFLATLAHELRNPLAPMSNALALLRSERLPEHDRERAREILERQLRHMVRLIDDLLDVSRVTTGKLSLHRQSLDLAVLLRHAVELAEPMAEQRRLALSIDVGPPDPIPVDGDPARLAQVFSNLLNNACRYTEPGGRIAVAATREPGWVSVAVADTGIGIDPSMQERVFELFEQADKSLGRGSAGLGIGLTLARQLVQLHGGDIRVQSAGVGQGATFTVRLPLSTGASTETHPELRAAPRALPRAAVPAASPPSAGPSAPVAAAGPFVDPSPLDLVLADDNVDFTASLAALLASMGHRVRVANDGNDALRVVAAAPPDIALLDIGMPGLDGYELARRLRADPATRLVRLVAITGWGQATDREAANLAGFDRHLVKPVDAAELLRVLEALRHPPA